MVKKILALVLSIVIGLALARPAVALEKINTFNTDIHIQENGTIEVEESIEYDFGSDQRHGIFRSIPTIKENEDGKKYRLDINVRSVTDQNGEPYQYAASRENGEIELKIGDPNVTISGAYTYRINYNVKGAITYFDNFDELYWNTTGDEWNVPITQASATVFLPQTQDAQILTADCYVGGYGSTDTTCTADITGTEAAFSTNTVLNQSEGMTIAATFPKNIVATVYPEEVVSFFNTVLGKIVAVGLVILLFGWYLVYPMYLPIRWYLYGRDPNSRRGLVRARYSAPESKSGEELSPAETGTLIDEHAGQREISALLIDLAQRGYLKIIENKKKDFSLKKTKEYVHDKKLKDYEKTLLTGLFSSSDTLRLKDAKIYSIVTDVQDKLYKKLVKDGYFPKNPKSIRAFYNGITVAAGVTFNFLLILMAAIFGRLMPRKTMDGVHASNEARSLKNFLESQERQLEYQAKNQMFFEKLLPFAVAFGVENVWAKRFQDIEMKQPDWYQSSTMGSVIAADAFTNNLNSSLSSFNSAGTPPTSSSGFSSGSGGGGFSGGGGGGGGGGSW